MTYHGCGQFMCDSCGDDVSVEGRSMQDKIDELKSEGWRAHKDGDEWKHSCPDCVKEFARENRAVDDG